MLTEPHHIWPRSLRFDLELGRERACQPGRGTPRGAGRDELLPQESRGRVLEPVHLAVARQHEDLVADLAEQRLAQEREAALPVVALSRHRPDLPAEPLPDEAWRGGVRAAFPSAIPPESPEST